jgi:TonB family protein
VIRPLSFLLFAVALSFPAAHGQSIAELAKSLEGHNFVLRNYYTDDKLTFDATGKLTSRGTPGFGPSDGLIRIDKVHLTTKDITFEGHRSAYFWDPAHSSYQVFDTSEKVMIVTVRPGPQLEDAVRLLGLVFLPQSELHQNKCLDTDIPVHDFSLWKLPESQSFWMQEPSETKKICFPGGERAQFRTKGIDAPKAIHFPEPPYPDLARQQKKEGTVVLDMIIDESGKPTTVVVTRSLGYDFDDVAMATVRHWIFKPTKFQGRPIPFAATVEVNFRLN